MYRDLGVGDRSLSEVGRKLSKSKQAIAEVASRYGWRERVAAWDAEADRQTRVTMLAGIVEMNTRHLEMALVKQRLAARELEKWDRRSLETDSVVLTVEQIIKLATGGIQLERECRAENEAPETGGSSPTPSRHISLATVVASIDAEPLIEQLADLMLDAGPR